MRAPEPGVERQLDNRARNQASDLGGYDPRQNTQVTHSPPSKTAHGHREHLRPRRLDRAGFALASTSVTPQDEHARTSAEQAVADQAGANDASTGKVIESKGDARRELSTPGEGVAKSHTSKLPSIIFTEAPCSCGTGC